MLQQVAPGLRRWTAPHDHWEEDVGSVAVETSDGLVLIDPIAPPREVTRADHVLVTVYWHARSTGELGAKRVWAYFNNDREGYAIKNARELLRQLKRTRKTSAR